MHGEPDHGSRPSRRWIHLRRNPLVVGIAVALIGVGAVIWTFSSSMENSPRVLSLGTSDHEALLAHLGVDPASIVGIEGSQFTSLGSREEIDEVMREFEAALIARASATPGLREAGLDAWRAFAHTSALAMAPFLTGDLDHLNENIRSLGGVAPDSEEAQARLQSRWNVMTNTMRFTAAAPVRAEIADGYIESRNDAVRVGDFLEGKRMALRMGMRIPGGKISPTGTRFPAVARWDASDAPMEAYEAVLPVRLKILRTGGVRLASIGIVMAHEPAGRRWQPALIILRFDQAGDKMEFHSEEELTRYSIKYRPGNLHVQ